MKPGIKIGYLGGGQLARMLAQSAHNLGAIAHVLSEKAQDPGAQVCGQWQQGQLSNGDDLKNFLSQVDVATFESEFMDASLLVHVQKITKTPIYPSPQLMGVLQDRKTQKELFDQHRLPTSPWIAADELQDILDFFESCQGQLVFKKRFFGYDGYGTFIVKNKKQLNQFLKESWKKDLFIAERWIPFSKEYAMILARNLRGDFCHLPLVESFQKDSRCDWIKGPIKDKKMTPLLKGLKSFLKKTKYCGVMGVEFFKSSQGILINEIAPRVHNTGHYSIDTPGLSQFDLHNMCILDESLPKKISLKGGFAMANLIGDNNPSPQLNSADGLYWYGKKENRLGRKMGHVNALDSNPSSALKLAIKKRKQVMA